jgi:glycosyltransferase involved in cell wall biosynthesis
MKKIIISNGFNKFPLANAAAEVHKHGILAQLITGAYPTARVQRLLSLPGLSGNPRMARLRDREAALPDRMVRALWLPEVVQLVGARLSRLSPTRHVGARLDVAALRLYGSLCTKLLQRHSQAAIYHYRSGFGQGSVRAAKELGMITLCDHSIAHPGVLDHLIENHGRLPSAGAPRRMSRLWSDVLNDVDEADYVLVNSEFVKTTFLHEGCADERIRVIYQGVSDEFLGFIDSSPGRRADIASRAPELRLLFVGSVDRRKGADVLLRALTNIDDLPWRLTIVGPVEADLNNRYRRLLRDPRVSLAGTVSLRDLARYYLSADVFVFPARAEGSARVVFQALASGCYVITTPNAGSIVEDGVHGSLVPPGDYHALEQAIRQAMANRDSLAEIGQRNAAIIRSQYRQRNYGKALVQLYEALLRPPHAPQRVGD